MEKYDVLQVVGKGSFGRVFKARNRENNDIVALKLIPKMGHSERELKSLRQECKIQQGLKHPNVVQMLDSFETEKEVVVVTEYATGELFQLLEAERKLPVERVEAIACDLVSALYYLHSHRILHRDIKPQNILLGKDGRAKLCDFGFARTMGINSYVLTSIKGTPLYMAPELIEEKPYDHNADLWSLGCILYELLTGTPPFCTHSLIQLIRKICTEAVKMPEHITPNCKDFIQGLLEKDPKKRLTWPDLLQHPFIEGRVAIIHAEGAPSSLTHPLTASQEVAKEIQRNDLTKRISGPGRLLVTVAKKLNEDLGEAVVQNTVQQLLTNRPNYEFETKHTTKFVSTSTETGTSSYNKPSMSSKMASSNQLSLGVNSSFEPSNVDTPRKTLKCSTNKDLWKSGALFTLHSFDSDERPLENEEWMEFLDKTMQEAVESVDLLLNQNFVSMVISPLRNPHADFVVGEKIVNLLSLPFTLDLEEETLGDLFTIYLDQKVVPNLLYGCKLLIQNNQQHRRQSEQSNSDTSIQPSSSETSPEELQALESFVTLTCFLIHAEKDFLLQWCDSICVLNVVDVVRQFLRMEGRKLRVTTDILAILCQVLRVSPDNATLIVQILQDKDSNHLCDLRRLSSHKNVIIRDRCCRLVGYLAKRIPKKFNTFWSKPDKLYEQIKGLQNDEDSAVKKAAVFASHWINKCIST